LNIKKLTQTALFIAIGIIFSFLVSHAWGIQGTYLLPMHIPVLLCGLLLGWEYGLICGIFTPALSTLFTGMPPAYPMLPIMLCELATYGLISGLLYSKLKKIFPIARLYISLIVAMICGRVIYGLVYSILLFANNGPLKAASVLVAVSTGIIGIIIQLIFIPIIFNLLQDYGKFGVRNNEATCIIKVSPINYISQSGNGVKPLLYFYENTPLLLKNKVVYDRVIGKAAATICVLAGVKKVFGKIMSKSAKEYLEKHNIKYSYDILVDIIENRTGDGMCPLEASVLNINDPQEGLKSLKETIKKLMSKKGENNE